MLILLIAGSMILCGGVGRFWCIPAAGAAAFVIYKMLTGQNNYVQQRLGAWNGDEGDILYQTQQSLYSIASGGLTGLALATAAKSTSGCRKPATTLSFPFCAKSWALSAR